MEAHLDSLPLTIIIPSTQIAVVNRGSETEVMRTFSVPVETFSGESACLPFVGLLMKYKRSLLHFVGVFGGFIVFTVHIKPQITCE